MGAKDEGWFGKWECSRGLKSVFGFSLTTEGCWLTRRDAGGGCLSAHCACVAVWRKDTSCDLGLEYYKGGLGAIDPIRAGQQLLQVAVEGMDTMDDKKGQRERCFAAMVWEDVHRMLATVEMQKFKLIVEWFKDDNAVMKVEKLRSLAWEVVI